MQYNKHSLFKDIFCLVIFLHLILIGMLCFHGSGKFQKEHFRIDSRKIQSTIVFMPLHKKIHQKQTVIKQSPRQRSDQKLIDFDKYQKKVAVQKVSTQQNKVKQVVPISKSITAEKPVKSLPAVKNKPSTQVVPEKNKKNSIQQQVKPVKTKPKKEESKKNIVPIKQQVEKKKELPKDSVLPSQVSEKKESLPVVPEKIKEALVVPDIQQEEKKDVEKILPEPIQEIVQAMPDIQDEESQDLLFVGSDDLEMLQIQEQIKTQVAEYYKPPVGINKKSVCHLSVQVGRDGKAEKVTVQKSSGSIANDICARAALLKISFAKQLIGKEIIVELGQ